MNKEEMDALIEALKKWRYSLYDSSPETPNKSGERAELRRAKTILEVVLTPSYQQLHSQLKQKIPNFEQVDKNKLAFIIGLLAHVKEPNNLKLAKAMQTGTPPCVSELRFRRLLQHTQDDRFYASMIRIIRMLKGHVSISDLVQSMYYWNDNTKKQWAYTYFG